MSDEELRSIANVWAASREVAGEGGVIILSLLDRAQAAEAATDRVHEGFEKVSEMLEQRTAEVAALRAENEGLRARLADDACKGGGGGCGFCRCFSDGVRNGKEGIDGPTLLSRLTDPDTVEVAAVALYEDYHRALAPNDAHSLARTVLATVARHLSSTPGSKEST